MTISLTLEARQRRCRAIGGAAIPLVLALAHLWQVGILALAAVWLIGLRRGVVTGIVGAAALGVLVYLAGGPVG